MKFAKVITSNFWMAALAVFLTSTAPPAHASLLCSGLPNFDAAAQTYLGAGYTCVLGANAGDSYGGLFSIPAIGITTEYAQVVYNSGNDAGEGLFDANSGASAPLFAANAVAGDTDTITRVGTAGIGTGELDVTGTGVGGISGDYLNIGEFLGIYELIGADTWTSLNFYNPSGQGAVAVAVNASGTEALIGAGPGTADNFIYLLTQNPPQPPTATPEPKPSILILCGIAAIGTAFLLRRRDARTTLQKTKL